MHVGRVREITRYPVKSMAGVAMESAFLGWNGIPGDRRFAFRRLGADGGMPWLTASRLPALLLYHPIAFEESSGEPLPTEVRTPAGSLLGIQSAELTAEIADRLGSGVELMQLRNGIFDAAAISVISVATIAGLGREAGADLDTRRFRANIVLETEDNTPFHEDAWLDGTLEFGDGDAPAAVSVTMRDERCVMINLDPDTAEQDARIMKTAVRLNSNNAGVYATVVRTGIIRVGDRVRIAR